ncbi:MAG: hypothetical protein OEM24_07425, partial [Paracoccaceae bacterium]|nr:hypothetical protein [Paracoccaceae bacterium]
GSEKYEGTEWHMRLTAFRTQAERFLRDESGAVTIDWVVLTAGVSFLALIIIASFAPANEGIASRVKDRIDLVKVGPGSN